MDAGLGLQLVDQLAALALGDEAGGLDRVHQQLQLRQLEGALPQKPARRAALPALHIQPELAEGLHIGIDALAFGPDVPLLQAGDDLRDGEGVLLIGEFPEKLAQTEQFQFLIGAFWHGSNPLYFRVLLA